MLDFRLQGFFNIIQCFLPAIYGYRKKKYFLMSIFRTIQEMNNIQSLYIKKHIEIDMSKLPSILKGVSHCTYEIIKEIESQYSERNGKQQIPKAVLDKYLKIGNKQLLDKIDGLVHSIQPAWSLSLPQLQMNLIGVIKSDWPFGQQNKSIYLAVWGPLTLIFLTYLLHSNPYDKSMYMFWSAGLIHLGLILVLAFFGYVYSNILKFPFNLFLYHICISSHINLITIVYCCICMGSPQWLIIIGGCIFVGICTYLHFNIYNQSIKPTLLEFIFLLIFIFIIYGCAAYLFTNTFHSAPITNISINSHELYLSHQNFHKRIFFHQQ